MKPLLLLLLSALLSFPLLSVYSHAWADSPASLDGFPTGSESPEGVAADFARSMISGDLPLFKASTLDRCCTRVQEKALKYDELYRTMIAGLSDKLDARNPKKILRVSAARRTSGGSKESYVYAADGTVESGKDIMFVDVSARLNDGSEFTNRTVVVQGKDGRWRVHIYPELSSFLRMANEEP